jgi:hypothetical protein
LATVALNGAGVPFRNDHTRNLTGFGSSDDGSKVVRIFHSIQDHNARALRFEKDIHIRIGKLSARSNNSLMGRPWGKPVQHGAVFSQQRNSSPPCKVDDFLKFWRTRFAPNVDFFNRWSSRCQRFIYGVNTTDLIIHSAPEIL